MRQSLPCLPVDPLETESIVKKHVLDDGEDLIAVRLAEEMLKASCQSLGLEGKGERTHSFEKTATPTSSSGSRAMLLMKPGREPPCEMIGWPR